MMNCDDISMRIMRECAIQEAPTHGLSVDGTVADPVSRATD